MGIAPVITTASPSSAKGPGRERGLRQMGERPVVLAQQRPFQRGLFQITKKRTSCLDMSGVVNGTQACQGGDLEHSKVSDERNTSAIAYW